MNQYSRHFTIDEARSLLPHVKYRISEIMKLKKSIDKIGFNIYTRKYRPGFNPDTLTEFPDEFVQLMELIQSLQEDGVLVKSLEIGLVDFPAIRPNGEEVFLCWKDGEADINYWHSLNGGYQGRRPVTDF